MGVESIGYQRAYGDFPSRPNIGKYTRRGGSSQPQKPTIPEEQPKVTETIKEATFSLPNGNKYKITQQTPRYQKFSIKEGSGVIDWQQGKVITFTPTKEYERTLPKEGSFSIGGIEYKVKQEKPRFQKVKTDKGGLIIDWYKGDIISFTPTKEYEQSLPKEGSFNIEGKEYEQQLQLREIERVRNLVFPRDLPYKPYSDKVIQEGKEGKEEKQPTYDIPTQIYRGSIGSLYQFIKGITTLIDPKTNFAFERIEPKEFREPVNSLLDIPIGYGVQLVEKTTGREKGLGSSMVSRAITSAQTRPFEFATASFLDFLIIPKFARFNKPKLITEDVFITSQGREYKISTEFTTMQGRYFKISDKPIKEEFKPFRKVGEGQGLGSQIKESFSKLVSKPQMKTSTTKFYKDLESTSISLNIERELRKDIKEVREVRETKLKETKEPKREGEGERKYSSEIGQIRLYKPTRQRYQLLEDQIYLRYPESEASIKYFKEPKIKGYSIPIYTPSYESRTNIRDIPNYKNLTKIVTSTLNIPSERTKVRVGTKLDITPSFRFKPTPTGSTTTTTTTTTKLINIPLNVPSLSTDTKPRARVRTTPILDYSFELKRETKQALLELPKITIPKLDLKAFEIKPSALERVRRETQFLI